MRYVLVPFDKDLSIDEQRVLLEQYVKSDGVQGSVVAGWTRPFLLEKSEIADDRQFILSMGDDSYYGPIEGQRGFEVYHLQQKRASRLLTLDERRREINNTLSQDAYDRIFEEYRQQLLDKAMVFRFDMPKTA